jgi:hypothetical protein
MFIPTLIKFGHVFGEFRVKFIVEISTDRLTSIESDLSEVWSANHNLIYFVILDFAGIDDYLSYCRQGCEWYYLQIVNSI